MRKLRVSLSYFHLFSLYSRLGRHLEDILKIVSQKSYAADVTSRFQHSKTIIISSQSLSLEISTEVEQKSSAFQLCLCEFIDPAFVQGFGPVDLDHGSIFLKSKIPKQKQGENHLFGRHTPLGQHNLDHGSIFLKS